MLTIGRLNLAGGVIQSPMAGWTDLPFRLVARRRGLELAFTEMLLAEAVLNKSWKTERMMQSSPEDRPLGAQLLGYDPATIGPAVRELEQSGQFHLIDINLGCPVKKVTSKGGGSAYLKDPARAETLFKAAVAAAEHLPVTVKMRMGYEDASGDEAVRMAQIAESCGIAAVTVHGRTKEQGYKGEADYEVIRRVKQAVSIPLIGNGDVVDGESARRLVDATGCDGIMIGRGGAGNPWVYTEAQAALNGEPAPEPPAFEEIRQALLEHLDLQIQYTGRVAHLLMRRIACSYFKGAANAHEFRLRITEAPDCEAQRRIIESFEPWPADWVPA